MMQTGMDPFYIVLGIEEADPGFSAVFNALQTLGDPKPAGAAFWQLYTPHSFEDVFKTINTSMLDRRIDSSASLLLLAPALGQARWHLRQPLADLIRGQWQFQNNLLVSFQRAQSSIKNPNPVQISGNGAPRQVTSDTQPTPYNHALLERMMQLGNWAPISKNLWYISTSSSTRDAFYFLTATLEQEERISILDGDGNVAYWQQKSQGKKSPGQQSQEGASGSGISHRPDDKRKMSLVADRSSSPNATSFSEYSDRRPSKAAR